MVEYFNKPTEVNARLIAALSDAKDNGAVGSFKEFRDFIIRRNKGMSVAYQWYTERNRNKINKLISVVYDKISNI